MQIYFSSLYTVPCYIVNDIYLTIHTFKYRKISCKNITPKIQLSFSPTKRIPRNRRWPKVQNDQDPRQNSEFRGNSGNYPNGDVTGQSTPLTGIYTCYTFCRRGLTWLETGGTIILCCRQALPRYVQKADYDNSSLSLSLSFFLCYFATRTRRWNEWQEEEGQRHGMGEASADPREWPEKDSSWIRERRACTKSKWSNENRSRDRVDSLIGCFSSVFDKWRWISVPTLSLEYVNSTRKLRVSRILWKILLVSSLEEGWLPRSFEIL